MTVVSNTSPLCYLVLIGHEEILKKLYGNILVTQTVIAELRHPDAPPAIRVWVSSLPDWIRVHSDPPDTDETLATLDPGERTTIRLAEQLHADVVLLDELAARTLAARRGLKVAGVLGVLRDASDAGLLDLSSALTALRRTNFRVTPELLRSLYARSAK
jgi:predicted nucleic acid-binding protein